MRSLQCTLIGLFLVSFINSIVFSQVLPPSIILNSPDNTIELNITLRNNIFYAVKKNEETVILNSPISMTIENNEVLGYNPVLLNVDKISVNEEITTVWGLKKIIPDVYNEISLNFKKDYSIIFRVYNDGVAYRWKTNIKGEIKIYNEQVEFRFDNWPKGWFPDGKTYETGWEYKDIYLVKKNVDWPLPIVLEATDNIKVAITESDVLNYPSLMIQKSDNFRNNMVGSFKKYPLETKWGGYNNYTLTPTIEAEYIAKTSGTREFPWRVMIIADDDKELAYSDLVYKLASPLKLENTNWITPGKVAWEWWNDYVLHNVDFKPGVNTPTYLYHIDFAAKFGLEYILIDWKWTDDIDLTLNNPEVDIVKICKYAAEKDVKILVWTPAFALDSHLDQILDLFKSFGISGIKVDFFDRDDQLANQMYERIAKAAAQREFVVDFHGCAKPTGLSRMYPNVVNYEAVKGNENNKWGDGISPKHEVTIPFIRMLNGTMDFTPGGMRNTIKGEFHATNTPYTQGTRSHQAAMYVIYFETLKMLADAPTSYEAEPEYTKMIAEIPTTWDDTKVLEAKFGEHIVIARKTGDIWYIGAMTDWNEKDIEIDFSFLDEGNYKIMICKDGINSNKIATDYKVEYLDIINTSKINIHMAAGGGFVIKISK